MKGKIILFSGIVLFTGCGVMPYHDNFMCQGGSNVHICKRVSDVYLQSDNLTENSQNNTNQNNPYADFYNPNKQYIKSKKIKCNNSKEKELKDMIEAISYTRLKNPVVVEVIKEKCDSTNNNEKTTPLNKEVKVCVLNANIREKPSCKAKIVKVVHKNQKLYAYYLKGAWIKVKGGWIHKSLVCGECKEER